MPTIRHKTTVNQRIRCGSRLFCPLVYFDALLGKTRQTFEIIKQSVNRNICVQPLNQNYFKVFLPLNKNKTYVPRGLFQHKLQLYCVCLLGALK